MSATANDTPVTETCQDPAPIMAEIEDLRRIGAYVEVESKDEGYQIAISIYMPTTARVIATRKTFAGAWGAARTAWEIARDGGLE